MSDGRTTALFVPDPDPRAPTCPECAKAGSKPSSIRVDMSSSTLMFGSSFYDSDGRYHSHDPNTSTTSYTCSNGHSWSVGSGPTLCWCQKEK